METTELKSQNETPKECSEILNAENAFADTYLRCMKKACVDRLIRPEWFFTFMDRYLACANDAKTEKNGVLFSDMLDDTCQSVEQLSGLATVLKDLCPIVSITVDGPRVYVYRAHLWTYRAFRQICRRIPALLVK